MCKGTTTARGAVPGVIFRKEGLRELVVEGPAHLRSQVPPGLPLLQLEVAVSDQRFLHLEVL